jgi:hypothetical protein
MELRGRYLYADVTEGDTPKLKFYISFRGRKRSFYGGVLHRRFKLLRQREAYKAYGEEEIAQIVGYLKSFPLAESRRLGLLLRAESCMSYRPNEWRAATYTALANSKWYCAIGFELPLSVDR